MAYLTQDQAAVYSDVVAGLSAAKAAALLAVASDQVDSFCGRTFDTVLEDLPNAVAMAVALWAEDLAAGTDAGREKTREKVGDYEVEFSDTAGSSEAVSYPCPDVVATLLGPYRIIIVG